MKKRKENQAHYYSISAGIFVGLLAASAVCIGIALFRAELYGIWLRSRGREVITFTEAESCLTDPDRCLLCGNSDRSLMGYYRKQDTVGIISLNDWQILDFRLQVHAGEEKSVLENYGTGIFSGSTGEIRYMGSSMSSSGMASMDVTLPDDYSVDIEFLQDSLCSECLKKVTDSLANSKWKNEEKEAIPLCLIDFETSEIYSLQDLHKGYSVNDCWVEIERNGKEISVKVFSFSEEKG